MSDINIKRVLIVDDDRRWRDGLTYHFTNRLGQTDPYVFKVEVATSTEDCIAKLRARRTGDGYDVVVLDVRLKDSVEDSDTGGLRVNLAFAMGEEFGFDRPVRIIFTGYASYPDCVRAMRYGAWDYILKEDVGSVLAARLVVNSAVARLRQLDLRHEQEEVLAERWLPAHLHELQANCGGHVVALWHRPKVEMIASGRDVFDLEDQLEQCGWRQNRETWEEPFIVGVPLAPNTKVGEAGPGASCGAGM